MKTDKVQAKAAFALALMLIIVGTIAAVLVRENKMPKLSQEKMQENLALAENAKKTEAEKLSGEEAESNEAGYSKELEAFDITAAETSASGDSEKEEPQNEDEDKQGAEEDGGYLCGYTSERLVTEKDIEELNGKTYENLPQGKGIIQMVINEMYAKYGYQFQNEEIQAYFDQKEWYRDISVRSTDMDDIFKNMTDTEKANVEFLSSYNVEG